MGCYQPWLACQDLGIPSSVISANELFTNLQDFKNSAFFIMKERVNQELIDKLRSNNNVVVRYAGDGIESAEIQYLKNIKNLNGIIVGSKEYKNIVDTNSDNIPVCIVPANHDLFLDSNTFKKERDSKFRLYFGASRSTDGLLIQGDLGLSKYMDYSEGYFHSLQYVEKNMKNIPSTEVQKYVEHVAGTGKCKTLEALKRSKENPSRYSCHYAVRAPFAKSIDGKTHRVYEQWNTKTGGKVSTAAASGANIVTSLDPSVRVLIDENYPYSIDTSSEDFKENHDEICNEMVSKAKKTFGTKMWQDGLSILKDVKEKTKTHNITSEYVNFINSLY